MSFLKGIPREDTCWPEINENRGNAQMFLFAVAGSRHKMTTLAAIFLWLFNVYSLTNETIKWLKNFCESFFFFFYQGLWYFFIRGPFQFFDSELQNWSTHFVVSSRWLWFVTDYIASCININTSSLQQIKFTPKVKISFGRMTNPTPTPPPQPLPYV